MSWDVQNAGTVTSFTLFFVHSLRKGWSCCSDGDYGKWISETR
jgi:hypothetical protein